MTLLTALPGATIRSPQASIASRDRAVDVVRAMLLVVVVLLHAMMVGVSAPAGLPVFENAMQSWGWFPAATWIVQVMPLFFVLGGFSSYADWTRRRAAGGDAGSYIAGRVQRLAVPALAAIGATGALLMVLAATGAAPEIVAEAGFRSSQPLWFLGVYLLCTMLVPAAVAAHRRAPALAIAVLTASVLAVDLARSSTGIDAIGFANLLFVWLLVQQFGFFLADGSLSSLGRRRVGMLGLAAVAVLAGAVAAGVWSGDLFAALNPPTGALVLLGIGQLCAFELLRPRLRGLYTVPALRHAVDAIGAHSMTVYAWHMPVLIALAGVLLVLPGDLPVPLTQEWWMSRPAWLVGAGVIVALVARAVGRLERVAPRTSGGRIGAMHGAVLAATAAAAVLVVLVSGGSTVGWCAGAVVLGAVLVVTRRAGAGARTGAVQRAESLDRRLV